MVCRVGVVVARASGESFGFGFFGFTKTNPDRPASTTTLTHPRCGAAPGRKSGSGPSAVPPQGPYADHVRASDGGRAGAAPGIAAHADWRMS